MSDYHDLQSCIYEGKVAHCRYTPVPHRFEYRLFMVYLDLGELSTLVGRGCPIGARKRSSCSFLRDDHLLDPTRPLEEEARCMLQRETGIPARGPIRLLTQLRYWGHYLSPLNLYYAYDESAQHVEHVIAEVNNTPWNERHCYVLWDGNRTESSTRLRFEHSKQFHVSPFMGMDMRYQWTLDEPDQNLRVRLANVEQDAKLFEAQMSLQRRELNRANLRRMTWRYPVMTARIGMAIYFQALKLWWKKCPFYTHPKNLQNASTTTQQATPPLRPTSSTDLPR